MQQHHSIDGVVIRIRDMADQKRYLTVLTAERGRITILSKGSYSVKGHQVPVSQLYVYGNFEYYRKGTLYILKGGSPHHSFYGLSYDLDKINLASYLCDVAYELTDEGEAAENMYRLLLNSIHATNKALYPQEIIKGAFEMRSASDAGYEPDLECCADCGRHEGEEWYLDVMNGSILCPECLRARGRAPRPANVYDELREAEILCPISDAVRCALRYCIHAPLKRIFAFELKSEEDLRIFAKTAQTYLLSHLGRGFDSLDFYNNMRTPSAKG